MISVTPPSAVAKPRVRVAPTAKGRSTRARILEAGRAVLEERGYFGASITEITERSGVALGTLYRYFENKDALCLQLLEVLVEDLYGSVSGSWGDGDDLANLRETSRRYLAAYYSRRRLIAAMLQMAGAVPSCAALWWNLRKRTYDRMERYLSGSALSQGLPLGMTAAALGSMVEQFAYYWYVEADRNGKPVPGIDEAAEVVSQIWYRAVYEHHAS